MKQKNRNLELEIQQLHHQLDISEENREALKMDITESNEKIISLEEELYESKS
jgi:predicted  nucleic acid-binding Zn-ribbon protein